MVEFTLNNVFLYDIRTLWVKMFANMLILKLFFVTYFLQCR